MAKLTACKECVHHDWDSAADAAICYASPYICDDGDECYKECREVNTTGHCKKFKARREEGS